MFSHLRTRTLLKGALVLVLSVALFVGMLSIGILGQTTLTEAQGGGKLGANPTTDLPMGQWSTFGYNYEQTRHVPLSQITKENVHNLGMAWTVDFQQIDDTIPGGQETFPLVVDGTIYATTSFDHVFAIDAATGEVKWHFAPGEIGKYTNFGLDVNRGVAYCNNTVYMLTLDQRIMAIDAQTGKLVKEVAISDAVPDAKTAYGYYETHAPICYDGMLLVGSSGGDNGIRGFFMAYNADDLSPAWPNPYWTVPPEGQGWRSQGRFHGGGAVWMPSAIDTTTDTVYIQVGNPSPDFFPGLRPGANAKTNSIVALDLKTGEEKWWQQQTPNDSWDYDTTTPPMVFDAQVGGTVERVVSVATKEGRWYLYNAETGEPIYTGVQVVNLIDHPELVKGQPVVIAPSTLGGVNYAPQSYDPTTNNVILSTVESKSILVEDASAQQVDQARARGDVDTGAVNGFGSVPADWHDYGSITAVNVDTGEVAWKTDTTEPERSGVTTTDTGLAFAGGGDGNLRAFDTSTGAILWQFQTGAPIAGGASVYEVNGTEYVVVAVGGSSTSSGGGKVSRLETFALGGSPMQMAAPGYQQQGTTVEELQQQLQQQQTSQQPDAAQFISLGNQPNTVNINAFASFNGTNNGANFDGYANGNATFSVPQGWTVNVTFKNLSSQNPHSILIASADQKDSNRVGQPVFDGASTPDAEAGITSGTQVFSFTASEQGQYILADGVPGQTASGMWLSFNVTGPDTQPSLALGDNQPYVPGANNASNNGNANTNTGNANNGNANSNNMNGSTNNGNANNGNANNNGNAANSELAQFIQLGQQAKTVDITAIAAYSGTNGGLNFDGYANGNATISVPQGWTVNVTFKNQGGIPHSALIAAADVTSQTQINTPAFDGATTPDPQSGITSGTQNFSFTADQQGHYVLVCGVPGHGVGGMWINFNVTGPDTQPSFQAGSNQPYVPQASSGQ
jgi:alcohol dehydrogenase (cytochrome c)